MIVTALAGVPETLVMYGHQEKARMVVAAIDEIPGLEEFEEEFDREVLDKTMSNLDDVVPLHEKLVAFLEENPWPDLKKLEGDDYIESADDCWSVEGETSDVEFRYTLRGMVDYGPQPDFVERAEYLHSVGEEWLTEEDAATPPEHVEALLDLVLDLWRVGPESEYTDGDDAVIARADTIERRAGVGAAESYLLGVVEGDETLASRAIYEICDYKSDAGDLEGFIDALGKLETVGDDYDAADAMVRVAYLRLVQGEYEKGWKKFKEISKLEDGEDFPGSSFRIAKKIAKKKKASLAWWAKSASWWEQWVLVRDELNLGDESYLDDEWDYYEPWERVPKRFKGNIDKLSEAKPKKLKNVVRSKLNTQIEYARWHEDGTELAVVLLGLASEAFPKKKDEFFALVNELAKDEEKE